MKVLVIGGTGPTGPPIVEGLLQRSHQVTILHRGTHEVDFSGPVEHIHSDPHFVETLQQSLGNRTFDVTVASYGRLRYVAEAMKGHTSRLIAIGGTPYLAFGKGSNDPGGVPVPIPENAPVHRDEASSRFAYLMSVSEDVVMEAHREGHYAATMLRFPWIYGSRQLAPSEWSIIRRILDGRKHLIIPDGGLRLERRGYADNVAHAVLLAVDNPQKSAGQTYNVGDETILSMREWVALVSDCMGYQWELVSLPFALARPSRAYSRRFQHSVPDISKIKEELGYRDVVPAEEGIRSTVEWYLAHRPERGGAVERQLGDPFDYVIEDRLIQEYNTMASRLREVADVGYKWIHPYDHPAEPRAGK